MKTCRVCNLEKELIEFRYPTICIICDSTRSSELAKKKYKSIIRSEYLNTRITLTTGEKIKVTLEINNDDVIKLKKDGFEFIFK